MRTARLRAALGLERNVVVMLGALVILGMGEELWMRFVPKYLEVLGASVWVIAAYGALKDLLDALYPYPGGWLTDRLGRRASLVLFTALAIVGYVVYLFSASWHGVIVGTLFVMAWSSLSQPAIFAIIGDNLPPQRRAIGFGVQSILKRVPIVIAPILGGALIASLGMVDGVRAALMITLALALASIVFVWRYYREAPRPPHQPMRVRDTWRALDPQLKRLLVADSLARWAEGLPKVFIVLYVIDVLRFDALTFGWLTGLQMAVAILIYIPVAKLADRGNRKPFVLLTFAFFALFPLALVLSQTLVWVALAFAIAGLREFGEPARKALIVDLAPAALRGRAVGVYYLARGLAVFPAAFVGGGLWSLGPQWPFYAAFVVGVVALGVYARFGSDEAGQVA